MRPPMNFQRDSHDAITSQDCWKSRNNDLIGGTVFMARSIDNTPTETPVPITAHVRAAPPLPGWQEFQSRVGYSLWLPPDWGVASCDEVGDACGSGSWRQGSCIGEIGPGVTARQDRVIFQHQGASFADHRLPYARQPCVGRKHNAACTRRSSCARRRCLGMAGPRCRVQQPGHSSRPFATRFKKCAVCRILLDRRLRYTVGMSIATAPCSNLSPDGLLDQGQSLLRDILASFQT